MNTTPDEINDALREQVNRELPRPSRGFETDEQEQCWKDAHERRYMELVSATPARDHEVLNHVIFTEAQAARIESERPVDGVPIATRSGYELAAYRMPNGSRFVTLFDASEETWEAYCKEQACALRG